MPKIPIFEKKNVLVTGGAGFIGSHLCEALLKEAKVICLDNLISGSVRNIEHLLKEPDFEFVRADVSAPLDLAVYPELKKFKIQFQGVQEIYHLACPTSPKDFDQYKIETLRANSIGVLNVLELARTWHARVLFASSSVIYGPRRDGQKYVREDEEGVLDHTSPRACYDEGKRFAETAGLTYQERYGLDVRLARIFRTFGPRQRLGSGEMMPDFVVSALDGQPLIIYGDGEFSTSLTYITDLLDGLLRLMHAERNPGPVNLGSDEEHTLVAVAQKIVALAGSASKIVREPPLLFMRPQPIPDLTRAKRELGWFPITRLDDALRAMIDYTLAHKHLLGMR